MEENMQALMERLNSSSQFLQSNDMRVTEVRHGFAKVEMIIDEQILNIHGFVHGGALFSLADTVAGAASFATGRDSVTLTGTINYIKPGRGGKLIGIAQEISSGRTTGAVRSISELEIVSVLFPEMLKVNTSLRPLSPSSYT